MILEKTRSRSLIPKSKKPKYLRRTNKRLNTKRKFHAQDNETKTYKTKRTPADVARFAEACRMERLANPTPAEDAFEQILRDMGVGYEREKIWNYAGGNGFVLFDFFLPTLRIAIEVDGSSHSNQKRFDVERDKYFASIGISTIRFENAQILRTPAQVEEKIREIINERA